MGRGTAREASGGGAATSAQKPLRQRFALPPPHACGTGRNECPQPVVSCHSVQIGDERRRWGGFQTFVTPDLIRGPRLQRRDGSRIKSGMTKKGISSLRRSRGEGDRRRRRWWWGHDLAPFAPPSALRTATSPWLRHGEEPNGNLRSKLVIGKTVPHLLAICFTFT